MKSLFLAIEVLQRQSDDEEELLSLALMLLD